MQLKLAEYNADGKFERFFLELGKDFVFGGDYIDIITGFEDEREEFLKDEKDPLNRFDGLFNSRTYGYGRFVLIENEQDSIHIDYDDEGQVVGYQYSEGPYHSKVYGLPRAQETKIKNLHENPELYEKLK